MTHDELVEKVARKIRAGYRAAQDDNGIARAVLSVVLVALKEPTEEMVEAMLEMRKNPGPWGARWVDAPKSPGDAWRGALGVSPLCKGAQT